MHDGEEPVTFVDKSISTADCHSECARNECLERIGQPEQWNACSIQKLLTELIENKFLAIQLDNTDELNHSDSQEYFKDGSKKYSPDKSKRESRRRHRNHNRYRCSKHAHRSASPCSHKRSSSISKVQKWSDDMEMETFSKEEEEEVIYFRPSEDRRKTIKDGYTAVDVEPTTKNISPKRRRKRKRKRVAEQKKSSRVDPEDLPRRARWTIIITSGLLILTCMFMVGITLRMAPVIDEMVRTKNEELMNSLNRNTQSYSAFASRKNEG